MQIKYASLQVVVPMQYVVNLTGHLLVLASPTIMEIPTLVADLNVPLIPTVRQA